VQLTTTFILLSIILLVVSLVEFQERFYAIKGIFITITAICEIAWMGYVGFVLIRKRGES